MTKEPIVRATGKTLWLAAGLVVMMAWPGVALAASTVTGTVTFDGKAPTLKPIAMHLIAERKLIYAVLALTVIFFVALLFLPVATVHNGYWIH